MTFQNILVPLDGSELAETALKAAAMVANPGAHIHLLSITTHERLAEITAIFDGISKALTFANPEYSLIDGAADPRIIKASEDYMRKASGWLTDRGFNVTLEARPGGVVDTIVSVAESGYEIIVMVTHGHTGLSKIALGNVAEGILHKAPCPVLLIPAHTVEQPQK